ncbi:DUF5017 domain-containing protein [Pseudopedobacter beijingensis]|uniref:DUF5017 domain-containing protein n=1 Tax=Pseudopedobacter beijingensis TaxID=1207056 RepID=A0ABW4IED3_9SPHI
MKKYLNIQVYITFLLLCGCSKYELESPDFEVYADKVVVKVGDEINFKFEGNPPILYFYSGQFLNDYEQKNILEQKDVLLSFTSTMGNGTQQDQLDVFISDEFDGDYSIDNIRNMKWWTRITDDFTLANSLTNTPSTEVDLLNRINPKKPLYVAFRYITKDQSVYGGQNNWNIYNVLINTKLEQYVLPVLKYSTSVFGMYSYGNKQAGRSSLSSSGILFKGNSSSSLQTEYTEDWAVSKAISLDPQMVAVNKSISLKLFTEGKKENYVFAYNTPGTYKATFIGETHNVYGNKKVIKTIDITVNP